MTKEKRNVPPPTSSNKLRNPLLLSALRLLSLLSLIVLLPVLLVFVLVMLASSIVAEGIGVWRGGGSVEGVGNFAAEEEVVVVVEGDPGEAEEPSKPPSLTSCDAANNKNVSLWNKTDDAGNRIELVCVEKKSPISYNSIVRYEMLFHPSPSSDLSTAVGGGIVAGYCPYLYGHNNWRIDYNDDDGEIFDTIYWWSYGLPDRFTGLEPHSVITVNITTFIYDVQEGLRERIITQGDVTVIPGYNKVTKTEYIELLEKVPDTFEVVKRETAKPSPVNYTQLIN